MPRRSGTSFTEEIPPLDPDEALLQKVLSILRQTRVARNIPLRELTIKMQINNAHLSRAERGLSQPGFIVLERWCRALDLNFEKVIKEARQALRE